MIIIIMWEKEIKKREMSKNYKQNNNNKNESAYLKEKA